MVFFPSSTLLAYNFQQGMNIWDVTTSERLNKLLGSHKISTIALSLDDETLATGWKDKNNMAKI